MKPKLIFGDPDAERVELLKQGFQSHPQLTSQAVKSAELMRLPSIDAVFLTIMAAERWGARPIVHEAQVLETTPADRDMGWPSFVIAGVAGKPEDPRDPLFELRMIILAALKAVKKFNLTGDHQIQNIAFGPEWIGIRKLPPLQAAEIIAAAYDESSD